MWRGDASNRLATLPRTGAFNPAPDDLQFGTSRPSEDRWTGGDFTIPTGPERAVTFLGRRAWHVELAPPPHKPYPMQMTIDARSGLVLRQGNDTFGSFHEWTALDTEAELPDELFTFDPETDALADPLPR